MGAPERLHRQARLHVPYARRLFNRFCRCCEALRHTPTCRVVTGKRAAFLHTTGHSSQCQGTTARTGGHRSTPAHCSLRIAWARVAIQIAHWHPTPVALVLVVHWVTPCCALGTQLAKCKTQHRLCLQCRANWLSPLQMQNKFCTVKKMCGTGFVLCSMHCIWYVQFHVQCTRSTLHKVQCIRSP